jgi:hypothetical protein
MIRFELATNNERAVASGYSKLYPVAIIDDQYYGPLVSYFLMLDYRYIGYKQGNNIDNWLGIIDQQFYAKDNEEYFGDQVCVFFEGDKVKLIDYVDYENGKRDFLEMPLEQLKKLTVDWKWFVIDWEIKMIKGEL